jgi:hypothetical protein
MVSFIRWARQSEQHICKLSKLLFHYDYLRPEVRNGIAVILIYTFAAKKALILNQEDPQGAEQDMFTVLSHTNYGLGITNKLTLRIYSDPWQYFNFIKLVITALIDCGFLPENERVNNGHRIVLPSHVNGQKMKREDLEEFQAFLDVKQVITDELDRSLALALAERQKERESTALHVLGQPMGQSERERESQTNDGARKLITTISTFWYENKKQVSEDSFMCVNVTLTL